MIMPAIEILHLCRGSWWSLQWETGYRLRGDWCIAPCNSLQPVELRVLAWGLSCLSAKLSPKEQAVLVTSVTPQWQKDKSKPGVPWIPQVVFFFFLPCLLWVGCKKWGEIGSGRSPTDQQPESHQQTGIQLVNWTSRKLNPQRIHREMNFWSWTQADVGSMLHTRANMTLL